MVEVDLAQVFALALRHHQAGQLQEAEKLYRQILLHQPDHADAMHHLGVIAYQAAKHDAAVDLIRRAIHLNPKNAEAYSNLGAALKAGGHLEEAIAVYRQAIALKPDFADAHSNLGGALKDSGQFDEAVIACRTAIALNPNNAQAHINLGNALRSQGKLDEGIAAYRRGVALSPDLAEGHSNLGNALTDNRQPDEAIACCRRAIALKPQFAEAHLNLALALLMSGELLAGWREYEWRWYARHSTSPRRDFSQPQWDGGDLSGRTLLLHAEQGFGDVIQFLRYAPMVQQLGGDVIVECHNELKRLLQNQNPGWRVIGKGEALSPFDVHCPMLSLPLAFKTALDSIPAQAPYIQAQAELVGGWQQRLSPYSRSLKVGLVWSGNPSFKNDELRSPRELSVLEPLAAVNDVQFFSLQKGNAAKQSQNPPAGMQLVDWSAELGDFSDTAALIANLDLVISSDTAVAHLAGAMGKPVWVMLPFAAEWRWLLARDDSPWYPTMRLFRQKRIGDWSEPVSEISAALTEAVAITKRQNQTMTLEQILALAVQHHHAGRLAEAENLYRQILNQQPRHAEAMQYLGVVARQSGRPSVAVDLIRRAIELGPGSAQAYCNLSNALRETGALGDAIAAYRQAIALNPMLPEVHCNLGSALAETGQFDEAIAAYRQAIALRPGYAEAYSNLGATLNDTGRTDEALISCQKAIAAQPHYAPAYNNLGNALKDKGKPDEAIAAFRHAIALDGHFAEAHTNLGNCLREKGDIAQAIASCRQAIAIKPDFPQAHNNLANVLREAGQLEEAIAGFRRAIHLMPVFPGAHWNLSLALLLKGDFPEGWREFEWRWKVKGFTSPRRNFPQPLWDGTDLSGHTLLLHAEQGFGDTLQFVRYAPMVRERGGSNATFILECPPELKCLLEHQTPGWRIIAKGESLPPFDVHCPLMTLPLVFGTTLNSIPARMPYLQADAQMANHWQERLAFFSQSFKVGLVWAGNKAHLNDRNRSIALCALAPLAQVKNVQFVSLQKGEAAEQASRPPEGMKLIDWTKELADFADTAAQIANLDLVISADTAVAHLAGAMGKAVWVMLPFAPDWRWLLERADSPWYPSMRLFRQNKVGDWRDVMSRMSHALSEQAAVKQANWPTDVRPAVDLIRRAIEKEPNSAPAYCDLGNALRETRDADEAIVAYRKAISLQPSLPEAHCNLGSTLAEKGLFDEAIAAFLQVIALRPGQAEGHSNLGAALFEMGRLDESLISCQRAIALAPRYAPAYHNLGNVWKELGKLDEAIAAYRQALAINPESVEAYTNLGDCFQRRGDIQQAIAFCRRAIAIRPDYAPAHFNLANGLKETGQLDEAIIGFRQAIGLVPEFADAHWNLSLALLLNGEYVEGWKKFEWRWKVKKVAPLRRDFNQPQWDGANLNKRTLLLHAEQGFGDTIHFVRYAPLVRERGGPSATYILQCHPELKRLLEHQTPGWRVIAKGETLPAFDVHCPLMSLPLVFGTTLNSIPAKMPYLQADAQMARHWRERLAGCAQFFKVGLVWAGNKSHGSDRNRSIALSALAPLAQVKNVQFVSLQKGEAAEQASRPPAGMKLIDWTKELSDFADTAALIANLDLVISADTAVAHLAGAMGKPVWVMLPIAPDWRWMLEREDSPWYPSMKLFRQNKVGDWQEVVSKMSQALAERAATADQIDTGKDSHIRRINTEQALQRASQHRRAGRLQEAENLYRQIVAHEPKHAQAHSNLGNLLLQQGHFEEAIAAYRKAIVIRPGYAQAYNNLGNALAATGQLDEAIALFRKAIALKSNYAQAYCNLGIALKDKGQFDQAFSAFRDALVHDPKLLEAHKYLGNTLRTVGQLDAAIAAFHEAISIIPNCAGAWNDLGITVYEKGETEKAVAAYRQAIALQRDFAKAHNNLANALRKLGEMDEAIGASRRAITHNPKFAEAYCNLGNTFNEMGRFDEAIAAYREAIVLNPRFSEALSNLGTALGRMGETDRSIEAYRRAIESMPENADPHWNLSLALLGKGEFSEGWREFEWRWKVKGFTSPRRNFRQPLWDGAELQDRTLLLHAEQGFGDTLQFVRYAPMGRERAGPSATYILECHPELKRLLEHQTPGWRIIAKGESLPPFDVHCPLMTLPLVFGTTLNSIPAKMPYLQADAQMAKHWQERLALFSQSFKVGLVWAGNKAHSNDRNRSIALSALAPLAQVKNVQFVSLQKGEAAEQASKPPEGMKLIDWTKELADFADTAAMIANLDLVISADTAVAHLAGAMGKPVWMMLPIAPDWRWMLEREDSPWYPSMRLFRQNQAGDWQQVVLNARRELTSLAAATATGEAP